MVALTFHAISFRFSAYVLILIVTVMLMWGKH